MLNWRVLFIDLDENDLHQMVISSGGKIALKISKSVTHVVARNGEQTKSNTVRYAIKNNIPVYTPEQFREEIEFVLPDQPDIEMSCPTLLNADIVRQLYPNAKLAYIYSLVCSKPLALTAGTVDSMAEIDEMVAALVPVDEELEWDSDYIYQGVRTIEKQGCGVSFYMFVITN